MEVWGGNQPVDCGVVMSGLDAWVFSRPHGGGPGGGDVYYVSSCATGRVTRLLVADVSGHGAAVARAGAELRQLMRRYVNHIDQDRFVLALNQRFATLAEGAQFATAAVATFFAPTNQLALSLAGHPNPLHHRRRSGTWSMVEPAADRSSGPANIPLGVLEQATFDQVRVPLRVGDLVLLYTDSLIEARRADGALLGREGLLEVVRRLETGDPAAFLAALRDAVGALHPDNLTGDDVTLLLIRPNGLAPRVPWRQRLLAPLRLARGLVRSLGRGAPPMPWPQLSVANIGGALVSALNRVGMKAEQDDEGTVT
jgi:serine phosphatase RsbU (regulator of sigma subunit)